MLSFSFASEFSQIIEKVNSGNYNWIAGENFSPNTKISDIQRRLGGWKNAGYSGYGKSRFYPNARVTEGVRVPDHFDARKNWPYCSVI